MKKRPPSTKKTKQTKRSDNPSSKLQGSATDREDTFVVGASWGPLSGHYKSFRTSALYKQQHAKIVKHAKSIAKQRKGELLGPKGPKLAVRRSQGGTMMPKSTDFDLDCVPVHGPARRARSEMLRTLITRAGGKIYFSRPDCFVVQEFNRQEREDLIHRQLIADTFGKKANWRDSLIYGARNNRSDYSELASRSADAAVHGNQRELLELSAAAKRVQKTLAKSPEHKSKFSLSRLMAVYFLLQVRDQEKRTPTRAEIIDHLKRKGLPVPQSRTTKRKETGSNSQRLFVGPFLSQIPKAKPWEFEKKRRAGRLPIK